MKSMEFNERSQKINEHQRTSIDNQRESSKTQRESKNINEDQTKQWATRLDLAWFSLMLIDFTWLSLTTNQRSSAKINERQ